MCPGYHENMTNTENKQTAALRIEQGQNETTITIPGGRFTPHLDRVRFLALTWWIMLTAAHIAVLALTLTEQRIFFHGAYFVLAGLVLVGLCLFAYLLWSRNMVEEITVSQDGLMRSRFTALLSHRILIPLSEIDSVGLRNAANEKECIVFVRTKTRRHLRKNIRISLFAVHEECAEIRDAITDAVDRFGTEVQPETGTA